MATHELKVIPPYFAALVDGIKTFEVRKNDRAYQKGDMLELREWHPDETNTARRCPDPNCRYDYYARGHWAQHCDPVEREVSFVYAGDPRFGGIEPGYVVLALTVPANPTKENQ